MPSAADLSDFGCLLVLVGGITLLGRTGKPTSLPHAQIFSSILVLAALHFVYWTL